MSDAQTSALTPPERKRDYSRLTQAEVGVLLQLRNLGKTQTEIAQTLQCDVSAVSRWLAKLQDTSDIAKLKLKNGAERLAERVVKRANVTESLEVLDRLEVLPKREVSGNGKTNIAIIVGMPGKAAGADPFSGHDVCTATVIESDSVGS